MVLSYKFVFWSWQFKVSFNITCTKEYIAFILILYDTTLFLICIFMRSYQNIAWFVICIKLSKYLRGWDIICLMCHYSYQLRLKYFGVEWWTTTWIIAEVLLSDSQNSTLLFWLMECLQLVSVVYKVERIWYCVPCCCNQWFTASV